MKTFGGVAPTIVVVRPYTTRLRRRVWAMLRHAGLDMDQALQIPSTTPDEEAVAQIISARPDLLLVPFNAHRDPDGAPLDGLTFCRRFTQTPGTRPLPILMPVSRMAAANLRLSSHAEPHAKIYAELLQTRIMILEDDQLDDPKTPARVVDHLRAHGVFVGSTAPLA
ncbi:MAG: hypothetical protein AAGF11_17370 [Myxococcota bacterium]